MEALISRSMSHFLWHCGAIHKDTSLSIVKYEYEIQCVFLVGHE